MKSIYLLNKILIPLCMMIPFNNFHNLGPDFEGAVGQMPPYGEKLLPRRFCREKLLAAKGRRNPRQQQQHSRLPSVCGQERLPRNPKPRGNLRTVFLRLPRCFVGNKTCGFRKSIAHSVPGLASAFERGRSDRHCANGHREDVSVFAASFDSY